MFIFVTCDVSPIAGFAWFSARAVLKNLERTPPLKRCPVDDKYVLWMNVTWALVCGLHGTTAFCILYESCM